MSATIYLIRHAEAEGNLCRRIQGQFDGFLTVRGRRQLARLAARFDGVPLDAVWASDLYRARVTAAAAAHGLPVRTTPRLREMALGVWEDQLWGNAQRDMPEQLYRFSRAPDRWHIAGGEPFADVTARMVSAVRDIAARHDGQTVAVVSHGMALRALQAHALGLSVAEMGQVPHGDNTCVSRLLCQGGTMRIELLNDVSHLDGTGLSTLSRQSWHRDGAAVDLSILSSRPLRLPEDEAFYLACYESSWRAAHGGTQGFYPRIYAAALRSRLAGQPECAHVFFRGGEPVGVLELDLRRGADAGAGWICLCCVTEPWRGQGYGLQLLGEAVSRYRRLGRRTLALHAAVTNTAALGFYRRCGFAETARVPGAASELLRMERPIYPPDYRI